MAQVDGYLEGPSSQPDCRPVLCKQLRERARDVRHLITFEVVSEQPFPDNVHHLGDDELGSNERAVAAKQFERR
jgi:hypothetical protein